MRISFASLISKKSVKRLCDVIMINCFQVFVSGAGEEIIPTKHPNYAKFGPSDVGKHTT